MHAGIHNRYSRLLLSNWTKAPVNQSTESINTNPFTQNGGHDILQSRLTKYWCHKAQHTNKGNHQKTELRDQWWREKDHEYCLWHIYESIVEEIRKYSSVRSILSSTKSRYIKLWNFYILFHVVPLSHFPTSPDER